MVTEKEETKKGELSDSIAIKGYVTIWQGEGKEKKIICERKENHWVDQGIRGLISALLGRYFKAYRLGGRISFWCYSVKTYLGTDTVTATTHGMTELTSPIGAPPGTGPNSVSGEDRTNPSSGTWKTSIVAQWFAGTVSGTVGELGLYMRPFTDLTPNWLRSSGLYGYPRVMVSRLSEADADFSSFVIVPTKSLTVQWDLEVSFA